MSNSNKQEFNPLVIIPSPRDIDIVEQKIDEILVEGNNALNKKYDVLWVKYYKSLQAYNIGAKYFLDNKEQYSHLVIVPDDLLLDVDSFDILAASAPYYPVLSGVCNMSLATQKDKNLSNITLSEMPDPSSYTTKQIMNFFLTFDKLGSSSIPQKVLFSGLPCTFVAKWVIEKMGKFTQNEQYQCCLDLKFCKFLHENQIDNYMIPAARFLHLKWDKTNKQTTTFYVGKKEAYTKLMTATTTIINP